MRAYQEAYIANLKEIAGHALREGWERQSFDTCLEQVCQEKKRSEELVKQNMKLLREELFPVLDHIYEADGEELSELKAFAGKLFDGRTELDTGLYCQIHKALLNLARMRKDRGDMIRELYLLGLGYHSMCNKLVGVGRAESQRYTSRMRLCFAEAAAYLKYFDEIEDTDTRGYILRSCANVSLGQFNTPSEKIRMVKRALQILQDKGYQEKEPGLPWDRYIYMTHQQMVASISYSKENTMTPQDVEDVMESVYIVYQRRFQEASERKEKPSLRPSFSYYAIEYFCGMCGMDELLARVETLMDRADPTDISTEGMYGIISLPAFYCQYLKDYPEKIPGRTEYIASLYKRVFRYVEAYPREKENESLFFYLRQLCSTFVEVEGAATYKEFLMKLQMRFAPELYVNSMVVAEAAEVFCEVIIEEEPGFFDDIESIRLAGEPDKSDFAGMDGTPAESGKKETASAWERKRRMILDFARECGILHDVGKINFKSLYSNVARQWFEDEYEIAHLHTLVGAAWLEGRESTSAYTPVALGHHSWYDGSRGYPASYHRLECSCRQMVDVIGLLDWMNNVIDAAKMQTGVEKSFEEAVEAAVALEGRRFSPLLTARLRDRSVVERLKNAFEAGRVAAYRQLYEERRKW